MLERPQSKFSKRYKTKRPLSLRRKKRKEERLYENLNEGQFYADWRIADMSDSNYLKGRFNQFYDLTPDDQYYIEWDEEK